MNFVEYGGIQQYGQLLNGWMQWGVLGSEISSGGGKKFPTVYGDMERKRILEAQRIEKLKFAGISEEREMIELIETLLGSGLLN